jgi:hypothetical protein
LRPPAPRWLVTLAGLAAGLVLGLAYAWLIDPVRPTNAYPALLRSDYRQEWIRVATLSYLADGDLDLVQVRLAGMDEAAVRMGLASVMDSAWDTSIAGQWVGRARALADTFDLPLPPAPAPETAPDSSSPSSAAIEPPSAFSFRVAQRSHVCRAQQASRIEVTVLDSAGDGLPGLRLWLLWDEGADWAVTGLMPERGSGYADFEANPDVRYSLGLGEYGMPLLRGLEILECPDTGEGERRLGSWRIVIEERLSGGPGT